MIKKVIIYSLILALLSSIIAPDFVNAMGSSSMSGGTVAVIIVVTVAIAAVAIYYSEKKKSEKKNITAELIKERPQKNISQSGELIVFRW